MKLLIISHYFEEHGGGIEIVAGQLARRLSARGVKVRWLAAEEPILKNEPSFDRVPIKSWDPLSARGIPYPFPRPSEVIRIWKEVKQCEVLHLHESLYLNCVIGFVAAKFHRVPILLTQHIAFVPYSNPLLRGILFSMHHLFSRVVMKGSDRIVFLNERIKSYFTRFLSFRTKPQIVANGVDRSLFVPLESWERVCRRRQLLPFPNRLTVLFVGRFIEKKGISLLRELASRFPHLNWVFIGSGPLDPANWKFDHVTTVGRLRQDQILPWYQVSDLLILPSVGEGFPLVVQESMACGTPALLSEETVSGVPELNGAVYACHPEIESLTHLLKGIEKAPDDLEALRARVSEVVRKHWDWEKCAGIYFDTFSELVNGHLSLQRQIA